ncbi:hypothetical protein MHB77_22800 [Paenibacillus sp. FSL K6-3166]|nr:hypothetical protein [Paenibacillus sp. VTT E-133291]
MRFVVRYEDSVGAQLGESDHSTDATAWRMLLLGGWDRSVGVTAICNCEG